METSLIDAPLTPQSDNQFSEPSTSISSESDDSLSSISAVSDSTTSPKHKSYSVIPAFYHKLPKTTDVAGQKLREEARTLFLQKRSKELLDNNELKTLWALLEKNYTPPLINNEQLIGYEDYLRVVKLAGDKFKCVFFILSKCSIRFNAIGLS